MIINKPQGYDEVQTDSDYTPIELGGHKLIIKAVEEVTAGTGTKYLKVSFDTATDDIQPGYYTEAWKKDTRDHKKWGGVAVLFPTDRDGNASKTFKQFCTSIERSNGTQIQWGAGFEASIKGKKIGGVFGEEEYINAQGEKKVARKLFWWRSVEGIKDAQIPERRTVKVPTGDTGFMSIPDTSDIDLPFK